MTACRGAAGAAGGKNSSMGVRDMRKLMLGLTAMALTVSTGVFAGEMEGTVKEVSKDKMSVTLEDGMSAMAGDAMKLDGVMAGDKVKIMTDDKNMITEVEKMSVSAASLIQGRRDGGCAGLLVSAPDGYIPPRKGFVLPGGNEWLSCSCAASTRISAPCRSSGTSI